MFKLISHYVVPVMMYLNQHQLGLTVKSSYYRASKKAKNYRERVEIWQIGGEEVKVFKLGWMPWCLDFDCR